MLPGLVLFVYGSEEMRAVKHRMTVEVKEKKHFLGIPYTATEKKHIMVDGKTYRKMKREERDRESRAVRASRESRDAEDRKAAEALACAAIVLEEEMVDLFGE